MSILNYLSWCMKLSSPSSLHFAACVLFKENYKAAPTETKLVLEKSILTLTQNLFWTYMESVFSYMPLTLPEHIILQVSW